MKWVALVGFIVGYTAIVAFVLWRGYRRFNEPTLYRTSDGATWTCRRCRKTVIVEDGIAHCACPPNATPWEPTSHRLTDDE